jgi:hypothetical protein
VSDDVSIEDSPPSGYRCMCPPALDDEEEIEMALECWEREQEYEARRATADRDGAGEGEPT